MIQNSDYSHKTPDYFQKTQYEILNFVPQGDHIILDIGCAEGLTGKALKENARAKEVHGIELVPEVAERAQQQLDSVLSGNLEVMDFPYEPASFDYIIATDVLEHLMYPDRLLKRLQPFLKPKGRIIASVPNMQHIRIIWHLAVQGDWKYEDSGPLDRTHLRFFTKTSFHRLFTESGYMVNSIKPVILSKGKIINTLTLGLLEQLLSFRYICEAHKK